MAAKTYRLRDGSRVRDTRLQQFDERSRNFPIRALGLGYNGPAVIGVNWYEGMMEVDEVGYIYPTRTIMGGHCALLNQINVKEEYVRVHNSWGKDWGFNGTAKISFEDMRRLLDEDGEAVFFVRRKGKV